MIFIPTVLHYLLTYSSCSCEFTMIQALCRFLLFFLVPFLLLLLRLIPNGYRITRFSEHGRVIKSIVETVG